MEKANKYPNKVDISLSFTFALPPPGTPPDPPEVGTPESATPCGVGVLLPSRVSTTYGVGVTTNPKGGPPSGSGVTPHPTLRTTYGVEHPTYSTSSTSSGVGGLPYPKMV